MPYISAENDRREKLRNGEPALTAGELNYQIFYYIKHHKYEGYSNTLKIKAEKLKIKNYVDNFLGDKPNYQRYNDMTGCLIRCYREIKRRLEFRVQELIDIGRSYDDEIAKYEDTKIEQNGDVE